ncbi:MAG: sugar phosphate isomerase/epimerase [Actinobacteria bacterium]|nr:sugar phosphate isomerase/epimerase [Actinomycetota bacterium]
MKLTCQEHLIPGDTLIDKWDFISRAGWDGIELHGHGDFAFRARLPELKASRRAGVVMPSVCVIMDHFIGDFEPGRRRDAIENMKSLLSVIAEIDGYGAVTPASYGMFSMRLPPYQPPRSAAEDRKVLFEGLTELGQHAAQEGVLVLLEPLNRFEDHMLNRLDQAVDLCRAVGIDSVRVMGDLFHMNIEEPDIAASIRAASHYLVHAHLADSNRLQPGTGHTDFASAFAALKEVGVESIAMECGIEGDPSQVLPGVARDMRALL